METTSTEVAELKQELARVQARLQTKIGRYERVSAEITIKCQKAIIGDKDAQIEKLKIELELRKQDASRLKASLQAATAWENRIISRLP